MAEPISDPCAVVFVERLKKAFSDLVTEAARHRNRIESRDEVAIEKRFAIFSPFNVQPDRFVERADLLIEAELIFAGAPPIRRFGKVDHDLRIKSEAGEMRSHRLRPGSPAQNRLISVNLRIRTRPHGIDVAIVDQLIQARRRIGDRLTIPERRPCSTMTGDRLKKTALGMHALTRRFILLPDEPDRNFGKIDR